MSRTNAADRPPTEMEAAVLGVIWRDGPCTAYSIRKHFLSSPSPRWSGSAGAIYPLLQRMEPIGWVGSTLSTGSLRKQRAYVITKKGGSILRRWLRQIVPTTDTALVHDPLRLKILFLDALSDRQGRKLIENAINEIRVQLTALQSKCDQHSGEKNRAAYFADRNALLITQARLAWLDEVLVSMGK